MTATISFNKMVAGRGGWSEWAMPIMHGYLMKCCDCGLVHEMQFKVWRQTTQERADGTWAAVPVEDGRVEFRARRYSARRRLRVARERIAA